MGKVLDAADFQRRLDEAENVSVADEFKGIITGNADAASIMRQARENALLKARKQLARAIRAEDEKMRASHVIPVEVEQIVTGGGGDELVKL